MLKTTRVIELLPLDEAIVVANEDKILSIRIKEKEIKITSVNKTNDRYLTTIYKYN